MEYLQERKAFSFKNYPNNFDEFCANVHIQNYEVEFCIHKKYFESETIDWDFVEKFTLHFIENFDFISKKSRRVAINIYNEYGNRLANDDRFTKDDCRFTNLLLVELLEPCGVYPKAELNYLVDNVFDSEFTYINTSCIFGDYRGAHFVGVRASNIQL